MKFAACLSILMLLGCAAGTARVVRDGATGAESCEVSGVAAGRAEISAYRPGAALEREHDENSQTELEQDVCSRLSGGSGSAGFLDAAAAAIGALFGWLAAP